MSDIQVNTSELRNGSQNLHGAANELGGVKNQIGGIPGNVGNAYDGQLRQALQGILGGSVQTGAQLQSRSIELGDELLSRSVGFEAANEAGRSSMLSSSHQFNNFLNNSSVSGISLLLSRTADEKAKFLWGLGGLGFGGLASIMTYQLNTANLVPPFQSIPKPGPMPNAVVSPKNKNLLVSSEKLVKNMDDLLKPIDKLSEHAPKQFDTTLENVGRLLNTATGQRGHIKLMSELGDMLKGTAKTAGAIGNLLTLRDFSDYFSGKITNQQVADNAIKAIVWIPVVNEKISNWLTTNMVDPNGKWKGFVTKVE
jgi:hypothetical protein